MYFQKIFFIQIPLRTFKKLSRHFSILSIKINIGRNNMKTENKAVAETYISKN